MIEAPKKVRVISKLRRYFAAVQHDANFSTNKKSFLTKGKQIKFSE